MKKLFRLPIELILLVVNVIAAGVAWFDYFYTKETNVFVIGLVSLICLVAIASSYKTIAYIRKITYRMW